MMRFRNTEFYINLYQKRSGKNCPTPYVNFCLFLKSWLGTVYRREEPEPLELYQYFYPEPQRHHRSIISLAGILFQQKFKTPTTFSRRYKCDLGLI
jgi:hypothetical protein